MFFQRRWAGRYIVMGTTRQTPCRFSGPALRYGEPVGKQASIQEARPDPRFVINLFDAGESYTEQEHRGWLSDAGFLNIERANFLLPDGDGVMTARKPK